MTEYDVSTYGERIADVYDDWHATLGNEEQMAEVLAGLADDGPALELGIGTGRVALRLRERGIEVHGVDASPAMVERLREKPGGAEIPVSIGDFVDVPGDGRFALVYVVFNTFFGLLSQNDQVQCFEGVARALRPGGVFVLECFVPDVARFDRGQRVHGERAEADVVRFSVAVHDPVEQRVRSSHVEVRDGSVRLFPVHIRYAFVSELDLMARVAGLALRSRWSGWDQGAFTAASGAHVSVYERPS
jgi:SAM-dependent methyltransferase